MHCEVLLFAQLAEAVGAQRLKLHLQSGSTVSDALARLAARHEAVAEMQGRIAVAVDETYATPETILRDGQTIALIPPVSGG